MNSSKKFFLLTTVICLLPMIFGIAVCGKVPAEIPMKWYSDGSVGQYMPKEVTIFGLPLFLAVINGVVHFAINTDPKKANIGSSLKMIGKWICPLASLIAVPCALLYGMGYRVPMERVIPIVIGIAFVAAGNYFPKSRRNYTVGIKIPWTLNSDENWKKTHHLAAYMWMISGVLIILMAILPGGFLYVGLPAAILLMAFVPIVYSYLLYRKGI